MAEQKPKVEVNVTEMKVRYGEKIGFKEPFFGSVEHSLEVAYTLGEGTLPGAGYEKVKALVIPRVRKTVQDAAREYTQTGKTEEEADDV